jgi:two-component system, NarL family, response regulator LiaR
MIRVAVIEDIPNYRNALEVLLNGSEGFECVAAFENAETAQKELPAWQPDIALVDINLPGMNGIELVRFIRTASPATLCMMCTAYDEDEKVFKALEAGAHGYILKSTSPAKLLEAIVDLKNGGSPMSNEIARKVVMAFNKKPNPALEELSAREKEVLELLVEGLLYKEIATRLNISKETVKRHCFNIYQKLHVSNRSEAIGKYHNSHHR